MHVKTVVAATLICGLVSLGGCATMSKKGDSSANIFPNDHTDWKYVETADRAAKTPLVQVVWSNPPDNQSTRRN